MPLGIVSEKDFEKEIGNCVPVGNSIPISGEVINPKPLGRGNGKSNVPDSIRKIIGEEFAIEGRAAGVEMAEALGLSHQSAEAYGNGTNSLATYNKPTSVRDHINNRKEKIAKRASSKLYKALDSITDDKLVLAKASDLSAIARNLSGVIKDMEPDDKGKDTNGPNIQFIMYAPKLLSEDKFPVMQVNE
jgi:hypothetical protein